MSPPRAPLALRLVVSSGEPLPPRLLRRLRTVLPPGATVLNLYGSTEVAGDCTCCAASSWRTAGSRPELERGGGREDASAGTARAGRASGAAANAAPCDGGEPLWKRARLEASPEAGSADPPPAGAAPVALPSSGSGQLGGQVPVGSPIDNTTVFVMRLRSGAPGSAASLHEGQAAAPRPLAQHEGLGTPAAEGEIGEVCVAGPGLAAGYLRQTDADARFRTMPASLLRAAPGAAVLRGPPAPLPGALQQMLMLLFVVECMPWSLKWHAVHVPPVLVMYVCQSTSSRACVMAGS